MKVEKVYSLLEKLKTSPGEVNEMGRRILKYIYQDIYLNCFDKEKKAAADIVVNDGAHVGSIRYNDVIKPYDENKKNIAIFLEGDKSIISYFSEMVNDEKKEFMDLFFDKIRTYFDIVDNHFYSEDDFKVYSFTFNIYCMLKAYREHKDDFEVYSNVVEDCSFLIDCGGFYERYSSSFSKLNEKKEVIDRLLSCNCYLEVRKISEILRDTLSGIARSYLAYDVKEIENEIVLINNIYYDYNDLKEKVSSDKLKPFDDIISRCTFKDHNRAYCPYYTKILLIGDRLSNINEKLSNAFENEAYRNNAFNMIVSLNLELFEYLEQTVQYKGNDSFISCMDIVFDSDTFYEFNSKMRVLQNASLMFIRNDKEKALELVNSLNDIEHKKRIDGKIISYQDNTMKPVDKTTSIFRRMLTLYDNFYRSTFNVIPLMRDVMENTDLFDYDSVLSQNISEELERIKQSRLVEERRQAEIRRELEELSAVQRGKDVQIHTPTVVEASELIADLQEEKNDSDGGKGFQKFKSIFGKKN